jgi:hypothetical protein
MIYETAVPVSSTSHADWYVEAGSDYAFCRNVHSVPLLALEFASATLEYVIVFAGSGDLVMPAAVLGVWPDKNLYVTRQGSWQAKYIPAFVRRYPFVFSSRDEGKTLTLCIDEAFPGINRNGRGQRLFEAEGKPTDYLNNVLNFLQHYQLEFQRTEEFCKKLKNLSLLEPMQAQVNLRSGERLALRGFSVVDRARLKTLRADVLAELMHSDQLEWIYSHLASMRNFASLKDRLVNVTAHPRHADSSPSDRRSEQRETPRAG